MTITGQNFEIYQGETKQLVLTITDENGAILDLTGYEIIWVAYNLTTGATVLTKSSGVIGEIEIPTPASGQIYINLLPVDTENLTPKTYGHQCESIDALGAHSMFTTGQVDVLKSISHPLH